MLRRMLLGLVGVGAVCGAVAAQPPGLQPRRQVEGRELDPVTREHYLPESPPTEDATPDRGSAASGTGDSFWAILFGAHAAVIKDFTMPLGTIEMPSEAPTLALEGTQQ